MVHKGVLCHPHTKMADKSCHVDLMFLVAPPPPEPYPPAGSNVKCKFNEIFVCLQEGSSCDRSQSLLPSLSIWRPASWAPEPLPPGHVGKWANSLQLKDVLVISCTHTQCDTKFEKFLYVGTVFFLISMKSLLHENEFTNENFLDLCSYPV